MATVGHFAMGAINQGTQRYEYPGMASKGNCYACPGCGKRAVFRQGKIKRPHFAHVASSCHRCSYFTSTSPTQVHNDAKLLVKMLLESKRTIHIRRACTCYLAPMVVLSLTPDMYVGNIEIRLEYCYHHPDGSRRFADVAWLQDGVLRYVFEIHYSNKTQEYSREGTDWYEFDADALLRVADTSTDELTFTCTRVLPCIHCQRRNEERQRQEGERQTQRQVEAEEALQRQCEHIVASHEALQRQREKRENEAEEQQRQQKKKEKEAEELQRQRKRVEEEEALLILKKMRDSCNSHDVCPSCHILVCRCTHPVFSSTYKCFCTCCSRNKCLCR